MAAAAEAVRRASDLVAQAIAQLTALGSDAPVSVRETLAHLGHGFALLGSIDPETPWSIPMEADE